MKQTILAGVAATLLAAVAVLPASNSSAANRAAGSAGVKSGSLLAPDKGNFKILVSGQQIGTWAETIARDPSRWPSSLCGPLPSPISRTPVFSP